MSCSVIVAPRLFLVPRMRHSDRRGVLITPRNSTDAESHTARPIADPDPFRTAGPDHRRRRANRLRLADGGPVEPASAGGQTHPAPTPAGYPAGVDGVRSASHRAWRGVRGQTRPVERRWPAARARDGADGCHHHRIDHRFCTIPLAGHRPRSLRERREERRRHLSLDALLWLSLTQVSGGTVRRAAECVDEVRGWSGTMGARTGCTFVRRARLLALPTRLIRMRATRAWMASVPTRSTGVWPSSSSKWSRIWLRYLRSWPGEARWFALT
jgi:hypothetical protein